MHYATKTAPPPGGEPQEFVLSDNSVDRMGDVVEQDWELGKLDPIALFNHDRRDVIGTWQNVRVEGDRLIGRLKLAKEGTSEIVNTVRKLVAQKILRSVSVGFRPLQMEKLNPDASEFSGPFRFLKNELLEASLVAVPANANAVSLARSMNLSPDLVRTLFSMPANERAADQPARTPKPAAATAAIMKANPMQLNQTLAARISDAQRSVIALRDRLNELTSKDEQDEQEAQRADELPDEIETAEERLRKLLRQEKAISGARDMAMASEMAPAEAQKPKQEIVRAGEILPPGVQQQRRIWAEPKSRIEPADQTFRALNVLFTSHVNREPIDHILRNRYGERDETLNTVLRAAVNPSMTSVAGNAAELVQTVNVGFMDRILFKSLYAPLAARGPRYTFGPGVTQIKIPVRTTTAQVSGAWVGEGAPKPVKPPSFSSVPLTPFKLAVISTFTEEMALYSNPAIEGIIRQAMTDDTSVSLDTYLIDATASSSTRPAGLRYNIAALTATASGTLVEKMVADIKQIINAIVASGGGSDIVIMMNPAQSVSIGFAQTTTGDFMFSGTTEAGQRFNVTFIVSQTVTAGMVIGIEASEFASATGDTPRFAVSNEATLHEESTTPLAIGTAGSPNTVAAPVRSLFQTDSIAIRLTLYVSWVMRRSGMVAWINSVGW